MANTYEIDTLIRLASNFTNTQTLALVDPTEIVLFVQTPSPGSIVSQYKYSLSQVVKDSTGMYHYDLLGNSAGTWTYKWQATGGTVAVTSPDTTFTVKNSVFSPPL